MNLLFGYRYVIEKLVCRVIWSLVHSWCSVRLHQTPFRGISPLTLMKASS